MDRNITDYLNIREVPLMTLLKQITTGYMFVNIGTIKKVHNENYIDVALYWTDNMGNEIVIPDVRLLKIGTNKVKIFITPEEGDNVLLVCPRDFIEKLQFERKAEDINFAQNAYSTENMCAILIKDESDDNVKTTVNIDANGNISVTTEGDANISANNIVLNGGEQNSHLVRYEELEEAVNTFMTALNAHTHTGVETGSGTSGAPTTMQFDISEAKVPTVLTEKASS